MEAGRQRRCGTGAAQRAGGAVGYGAARYLWEVVETGDDQLQGLAGAAEAAEDEDLLPHEPGAAAHLQRALLVKLLAALQEREQLLRRKLRVQLHLHHGRRCRSAVVPAGHAAVARARSSRDTVACMRLPDCAWRAAQTAAGRSARTCRSCEAWVARRSFTKSACM